MKASIEISLYPLSEDYRSRIIDFVLRLQDARDIEVQTNGMSTQLFGDYDVLMDVLKHEMKTELSQHRSMIVLKIGEGSMKPEGVADELK